MVFRLNPASGVPVYVQIIEQVKHAVETGAIRAGEQLPSVRKIAEDLLINPNTVARAYRDLEEEGMIELKHGSGAYIRDSIAPRTRIMEKGKAIVTSAFQQLKSLRLTDDEIRRLMESELTSRRADKASGKRYA